MRADFANGAGVMPGGKAHDAGAGHCHKRVRNARRGGHWNMPCRGRDPCTAGAVSAPFVYLTYKGPLRVDNEERLAYPLE